jgi:hypothetical protein
VHECFPHADKIFSSYVPLFRLFETWMHIGRLGLKREHHPFRDYINNRYIRSSLLSPLFIGCTGVHSFPHQQSLLSLLVSSCLCIYTTVYLLNLPLLFIIKQQTPTKHAFLPFGSRPRGLSRLHGNWLTHSRRRHLSRSSRTQDIAQCVGRSSSLCTYSISGSAALCSRPRFQPGFQPHRQPTPETCG